MRREVCCPLQVAFAEAGRQQLNRTTCLSYQVLRKASSGLPSLSWQIFYTEIEKVQVVFEDSIDTFCNTSLKMLNHGPDEGPKQLMAKTLVFFFLFIFFESTHHTY